MPRPAPIISTARVLDHKRQGDDLLALTLDFDPGGNPRLLRLPPDGAEEIVTVDGFDIDTAALLVYLETHQGRCTVTLFPAEKPFGLYDRAEFLTVRPTNPTNPSGSSPPPIKAAEMNPVHGLVTEVRFVCDRPDLLTIGVEGKDTGIVLQLQHEVRPPEGGPVTVDDPIEVDGKQVTADELTVYLRNTNSAMMTAQPLPNTYGVYGNAVFKTVGG